MDISTTSGIGHPFNRKLDGGKIWEPGGELSKIQTNVFIFDWSHHPAKTKEWHTERREKAENDGLLHVFAQEIDRDPTAALARTLIRRQWVDAAVDLHHILPELEEGGHMGGFDVADEGNDQHAFSQRKGLVLKQLQEWGTGDVGKATRKAIGMINGTTPINIHVRQRRRWRGGQVRI